MPIVFYQKLFGESKSDRCLGVMMQASQACDPGSNPGGRTTFSSGLREDKQLCTRRVMIAMTPMSQK